MGRKPAVMSFAVVLATFAGVAHAQALAPATAPHAEPPRALCAVAFNDGPGRCTKQLLDSLRARDAKVTFFVLGEQVRREPDVVRRMAAEGPSMTIDLSGLPRRVSLTIGERIVIPLPTCRLWQHLVRHVPGRGGSSQSNGEVGRSPAPAACAGRMGWPEPPPLMLAPEFAVVEGLACGETTWRLVLARSFDRSNPAAEHDLAVTVGQ